MSEIWMRVSRDQYELPEVVAGSIQELAWRCGVKVKSIYESMSRDKKDGRSGRYVKVIVDDEEDEC